MKFASISLFLIILAGYIHSGQTPENNRFNSIFEHIRDIHLEETKDILLSSITTFDLDKKQHIWLVDHKTNQVIKTDKNGKSLRIMCRKGSGPSEVYLPFGIYACSNDLIYISSFVKRITVIDLNGNHVKSFVATKGPFPTLYIKADGKTGNIFISGPRYEDNSPSTSLQAKLIHVFNEEGKFLYSTLPISETARRFHLKQFMSSNFEFDGKGNIYAVQSTEYKINIINSNGELIKKFGNNPSYYKPVTKPYEGKNKGDYEKYEETISYVEDIFLQDGNLYMLTHNFSRRTGYDFFIDVFDLEGNRLISGIPVPDSMQLNRVKNNKFYFLQKKTVEDGSYEENIIKVYSPRRRGNN